MSIITDIYSPNQNLYLYKANIRYVLNNETIEIDPLNIKSILIDYDYSALNMPMIFVTLNISQELLDVMIENQNAGTILFDMNRSVGISDVPDLFTRYISDEFLYFVTEGDNDKLDETQTHQVTTTIGLLSLNCINNNKKSISGVVSCNQITMLYYLLSHMPVVIEPPRSNKVIENMILPPVNSIAKMLQYLNSVNTFYTTQYRFFIDFDCTYLLSSSGKAVLKDTDKINTILFVLKNEYDDDGKTIGMKIDSSKSIYEIFIDEDDYEISDDHISEKSFSKVLAANASGEVFKKDIYTSGESVLVNTKYKSIRLMNDNNTLLDNFTSSIKSSSIQFLIEREYIDSSVITPNKEYIIRGDEVYNSEVYDGRYLLTRKRDVFVRDSDTFISSTMMMLSKVSE